MNKWMRILQANRLNMRKIAAAIIRDNTLSAEQFCDDGLTGSTVYRQLVGMVWPLVENMTPRELGDAVAVGRGIRANHIGIRLPGAVPEGTAMHKVHANSQHWLGADWDGATMLRHLAATAIIAELCDQLQIDALRFTDDKPRTRAILN